MPVAAPGNNEKRAAQCPTSFQLVEASGCGRLRKPSIDIQLGRLTPMPELPRSGRMNLGRRFNAGAATHHTLRHVVTPEFNRRYATQRPCLYLPGVETPG